MSERADVATRSERRRGGSGVRVLTELSQQWRCGQTEASTPDLDLPVTDIKISAEAGVYMQVFGHILGPVSAFCEAYYNKHPKKSKKILPPMVSASDGGPFDTYNLVWRAYQARVGADAEYMGTTLPGALSQLISGNIKIVLDDVLWFGIDLRELQKLQLGLGQSTMSES
ncbi:hypothetical protein LTR85_008471 [Meristemomyces frigidus]|nr:hypothetical protein LTR85_008471 [Meristemomyces frigidus]